MGKTKVSFQLIPDGSTTIVLLHIDSEFYVHTEHAQQEAEKGVIQVIARLTGDTEQKIRDELRANLFMGDIGQRPEEQ